MSTLLAIIAVACGIAFLLWAFFAVMDGLRYRAFRKLASEMGGVAMVRGVDGVYRSVDLPGSLECNCGCMISPGEIEVTIEGLDP